MTLTDRSAGERGGATRGHAIRLLADCIHSEAMATRDVRLGVLVDPLAAAIIDASISTSGHRRRAADQTPTD